MPGSVHAVTVTAVLPQNLCSAFAMTMDFASLSSVYKSGEYQLAPLVEVERRSWKLQRRLGVIKISPGVYQDLAAQLRDFYLARGGAAEPFWFYDPLEAAGQPGSNWDATGAATIGRYGVRFEGALTQAMAAPGRLTNDFLLREVAVEGAASAPQEITGAVMTIRAAYQKVGGASPGNAGIAYSTDGGATWTGHYYDTGWGLPLLPLGAFGATDFTELTAPPGPPSMFRVRVYSWGTLPADGVRDQFEIYDISLAVTYGDGRTATLRPTGFGVQANGTGGAVNAAAAFDGDPSTFGYVYRTHYSGLSESSYLIFSGWL